MKDGEAYASFKDDAYYHSVRERFRTEAASGIVTDETALRIAQITIEMLGFSGPLLVESINTLKRGLPLLEAARANQGGE